MTKTPAAVCELEVGGRSCGIQAVGRCVACGRAFCAQHKSLYQNDYSLLPSIYAAYTSFVLDYPRLPSEAECVNRCVSCFEEQCAKVAELPEVKHSVEVYDAEQYFISKAARAALLSSGLPPVEIYQVKRHWEWKRKGILRQEVREQVEVATPIGRGWILGTFKWIYRDPPQGKDSSGKQVYDAPCLTALLDAYRDASLKSSLSFDDWSLLGRVSPYSRGYEALGGAGDRLQNDWIAAMQAVKRLAGVSS